MKATTAHNHTQRFIAAIDSIWSAARSYGGTHAHILEEITKRVYNDPAYKKLSSWYLAKISEHGQMKLQEAHNHYVVWMFRNDAGQIVPWEHLTQDEQRSPDGRGNHYWLRVHAPSGYKGIFDPAANTLTYTYLVTDKHL